MKLKYFFILILLSLVFISPSLLAVEGICAQASVSDISPSSIGIDEEFTLGIQIENCGSKPSKNVKFELYSVPSDIIIKESLISEIGSLDYASSERFLTYHMQTTKDAFPGIHIIKAKLTYTGDAITILEENYDIEINIIGEEAELNIASVKTKPVLPYENNEVELTLRIENFGDGDANSVEIYADHPFKGIKESFMGKLESNEDGPAVFTFIANASGEFEFPIKISYKDDFGDHSFETMISLIILDKKTNWIGIILTIIILIIIVWFIFYHFKTKKSKEEVIRQLLKGNNQIKKR